MRLVAISDVHLGYRTTPDLDQCEAGVAATFARAVDRIIALAPDLVVVGGDVFHQPKPTNNAILAAVVGFGRISAALPSTPIVIASGNHDLSKVATNACILRVLEPLGVHIADRQAVRFTFPDRNLSVMAVPDAPGVKRPLIVPDAGSRYNVLVLHGEVAGMRLKGDPAPDLEISHDEIAPARWDYVALGHYHCYTELAPNMFYAGSVDYTSSNPWAEIGTPKGFVVRDLDSSAHEFVPVEPTRRHVDLAPIDAHAMGAAALDAAIGDAVDASCDGAIVRLVVEGVTPQVRRAMDKKSLKAIQQRVLALRLDLRRPEYVESALSMKWRGVDAPGARAKTVDEIAHDKLATRELAPDVNRDELMALGDYYLGLTNEMAPTIEREQLLSAPRQAVA